MAAGGTGGQLSTRTLATIENYRRGPFYDQVTMGIGIWRYMREHGLVERTPLIGREEIIALDIGSDSNGQHFDDLDVMSLGPTNEHTEARVGNYNYRNGFYLGDIEQLENSGQAKLFSLLDAKTKVCTRQSKIDVAKAIVGAQGSNTKRPEGLRDIFGGSNPDATPQSTSTFASTNTSTLHGLAATAVDGEDVANLWSPVVKIPTSLGNNNGGMEGALIDTWMELKRWGGEPKVGVCDQLWYQNYAKMRGGAANANIGVTYPTPIPGDRPGGRVTKFGPGLPDLFWNGNPIIYDPYVTVPSQYTAGTDFHCNFIDPMHFKIQIDPRADWKLLPPRSRSGNDEQYVSAWQFWLRYRLECDKRNAHAIVIFNL